MKTYASKGQPFVEEKLVLEEKLAFKVPTTVVWSDLFSSPRDSAIKKVTFKGDATKGKIEFRIGSASICTIPILAARGGFDISQSLLMGSFDLLEIESPPGVLTLNLTSVRRIEEARP